MVKLTGTGIYGGVVYAPARWWLTPTQDVMGDLDFTSTEHALAAVAEAFDHVSAYFEERATRTSGASADILSASSVIARDKVWRADIHSRIEAGFAVDEAILDATSRIVEVLENAGAHAQGRIVDLLDIRDRVLGHLYGQNLLEDLAPQEPCILLADDLAPVEAEAVDPDTVLALVLVGGTVLGHTAIIARQKGIPCIIASGSDLYDIADGQPLLIDATRGTIRTDAAQEEAVARVREWDAKRASIEAWEPPASTRDGVRVHLHANVADGPAAHAALAAGAEGIGLYRTEFSFLDWEIEPSHEEQVRTYQEVLEVFSEKRVVVRTFDAGADKPIEFISRPRETNPALGLRGIRAQREHPDLLARQLDAIVEASRGTRTRPWVMAPMVSTVAETRHFAQQAHARGFVAGAMVEVPAAALMVETIAPDVDFVSIGSNDLTQYVMAADRMSTDLTDLLDPWQPAVLRLIHHICVSASKAGLPISLCGEAAADPLLACVLVGFGVSSLSMAPTAIPVVGQFLSAVTYKQCQSAAQAVLSAPTVEQAKECVTHILE